MGVLLRDDEDERPSRIYSLYTREREGGPPSLFRIFFPTQDIRLDVDENMFSPAAEFFRRSDSNVLTIDVVPPAEEEEEVGFDGFAAICRKDFCNMNDLRVGVVSSWSRPFLSCVLVVVPSVYTETGALCPSAPQWETRWVAGGQGEPIDSVQNVYGPRIPWY